MTLWLGAFSCWWWSSKLVALFFHLVPFNRCFKSSQFFALLLFLTKASLMLLTVVKWSRQLNPRYCKLVPFIPRTESILPNTKILGIASRGWRMIEPLMRVPKRCDYWFILPLFLTTSTFTWSSARVSQSEPRSKLYWLLMTNRTPTPSISSHYPCSRYQGTSGAAWRNCLWISGQWFHIMVKIVFLYKALAHIEIIDSRQNNRWMVVSL